MKRKPLVVLIVIIVAILLLLTSFIVKKINSHKENAGITSTSTPLQQLKSGIEDKVVKYRCIGGTSITATYHLPDNILVDLDLSDSSKATLVHTTSEQGDRYTNQDETLVFQSDNTTASLTEDGVMTYKSCRDQSTF